MALQKVPTAGVACGFPDTPAFKLSKAGVIAGRRCVSTDGFDAVNEGEANFIIIFISFMMNALKLQKFIENWK